MLDFIFLLLYPIFFLIERILFGKRLNDLKENGETYSIIKIWTTYYLFFYIAKYFTAFFFYIGILRTAFELGKTEYYRSQSIKG